MTEQQHTGRTQRPRVRMSPTLRAKETEGERWKAGREGGGEGGRVKGIPGDEVSRSSPLLTVTGNPAHMHTPLSILLQPNEGVGGGREGGEVIKRERGRWEGERVCVSERERETASQSRRGRGGGWK